MTSARRSRLNVEMLIGPIVALGVVVIALGLARELLLFALPLETALSLKNLRHFSLNDEHNLSTWYSSSIMLIAATGTAMVWKVARDQNESDAGYWLGLAVLFVAMSVDEAVSFHEALITILADLGKVSPFFHFAWVVPGGVFVAAFALAYLRFLRRLPRKLSREIILAGAVFVTGALVLEMIDGWVAVNFGEASVLYIAGYCLEETFEIAGLVLFIAAVCRHLARTVTSSGWTFSLVSGEPRDGLADQTGSPASGYGETVKTRHLPLAPH